VLSGAPSHRLGSGPLRSFINYSIQQCLAIHHVHGSWHVTEYHMWMVAPWCQNRRGRGGRGHSHGGGNCSKINLASKRVKKINWAQLENSLDNGPITWWRGWWGALTCQRTATYFNPFATFAVKVSWRVEDDATRTINQHGNNNKAWVVPPPRLETTPTKMAWLQASPL
jgi:hypothetical protein